MAEKRAGLSLAAELQGTGVSVTTINPGFVTSEIAQVDNEGVFDPSRRDKRPSGLMWDTDDAARVMVRAIDRRRRDFTFTGHGRFAVLMSRWFPTLTHYLVARYA